MFGTLRGQATNRPRDATVSALSICQKSRYEDAIRAVAAVATITLSHRAYCA